MNDCPFCNSDERMIYSSEYSFALLSNPRLLVGHTLVIPRRHIEKPWQLRPEEILDIAMIISRIEQVMLRSGMAEGIDVRQNYRPFLPQSKTKVNHVHFHVIPRMNKDALYIESMQFEKFNNLGDDERNRVEEILMQNED
jgi:histidine triad (HIT) family protein